MSGANYHISAKLDNHLNRLLYEPVIAANAIGKYLFILLG